jgi:hypothetical protein
MANDGREPNADSPQSPQGCGLTHGAGAQIPRIPHSPHPPGSGHAKAAPPTAPERASEGRLGDGAPADVVRRMERGFAGILARRYPGTVWAPLGEETTDGSLPNGSAVEPGGRVIAKLDSVRDGFTVGMGPAGEDGREREPD